MLHSRETQKNIRASFSVREKHSLCEKERERERERERKIFLSSKRRKKKKRERERERREKGTADMTF